ncbi:TNT domain-containing protein [Parafrankia sp. FMc6]|uniref:TNT domain-containing protein n=1 Tax=Parafrankia soli TaxID=2599596 RepID=UPI0034D3FFFD
MRFRRTLVSLAAGGMLCSATAPAAADAISPPKIQPFDECSAADYQNDPRLGPAKLPFFGDVGDEVDDYSRTGGHSTDQFLGTWWDPSASFSPFPSIPGNWIFPPADGYYINPDGSPIRTEVSLVPGQRIDRFGLPRGSFLSPRGTDYENRSIPPSNLDDAADPGDCNYHAYQVVREFRVFSGAIRPWFDQPGNGLQYQVVCSLVPGGTTSPRCNQTTGNLQVQYLLDNKYLVEVPADDRIV